MREIFDKNFKDRSAVDAKFLRYVEECVGEKINKSKALSMNVDAGEAKLNDDVLYIIEKLAYKFIEMPEDKMIKNMDQLLSIFEKVVYHEFTSSSSGN